MKKLLGRLALLTLFAVSCRAQSAIDLQTLVQLILNPGTTVLTVAASQGNGESCHIVKIPGAAIFAVSYCQDSAGNITKGTDVLHAKGPVSNSSILMMGDVLCLLVINPTSATIGNAPANGIGWQCSTNVRTGGAVTGNSPVVSGGVAWP